MAIGDIITGGLGAAEPKPVNLQVVSLTAGTAVLTWDNTADESLITKYVVRLNGVIVDTIVLGQARTSSVAGLVSGQINLITVTAADDSIEYGAASIAIMVSEGNATQVYASDQLDILTIIQDVQRRLRLKVSSSMDEPHAKLLLSFANEVQRDYIAEYCNWIESVQSITFDTVPGQSVYPLETANGTSIRSIESIQIAGLPSLAVPPRSHMQRLVNTMSEWGLPVAYNEHSRVNGVLRIELWHTPDTIYSMTAKVFVAPPVLVNATDKPMLDHDLLTLGIKYMALEEQGLDFKPALAAFQAKISLLSSVKGVSDGQDMDFL